MPMDIEYGGHGKEVMEDMMKRYGDKKGKMVYHATMMKMEQKKKRKRGAKS